ncbi:hypothetical protein [Streptococcus penaeicida]|uniref:hypothetical protein n=1 Tax=Streptococcus penaeicida TaxID=1765960 RepID=UPI0039EE5D96
MPNEWPLYLFYFLILLVFYVTRRARRRTRESISAPRIIRFTNDGPPISLTDYPQLLKKIKIVHHFQNDNAFSIQTNLDNDNLIQRLSQELQLDPKDISIQHSQYLSMGPAVH